MTAAKETAPVHTTAIRYRRLESHRHGYGHDAVELEAQIDPGDDPETAFLDLRKQVLARLGHIADLHQLCDDIDALRRKKDSLERTVTEQRREIAANRAIIESHEDLARLAQERGITLTAADAGTLAGLPF